MWWILFGLIYIGVLVYHSASLAVFSLALFLYLFLVTYLSHLSIAFLMTVWILYGITFTFLGIYPLRRWVISRRAFDVARRTMPMISQTEKEALQAGNVSWEGDLFSGHPNWDKLLKQKPPALSPEEKAFIDGPVEWLCNQIDDWKFTHVLTDLPEHLWSYIKEQGFLGMIIPKRYGGLEFSAWGHASVLIKIYSRSIGVATTVSVPNSLGPAELILKYGTDQQKNYYLPRLAKGEEIPCFALTGPTAGSDAAAIPDFGIVCRDKFENKEVIGIRLNWNKRYITLAPVATLLGLAFKLYDPDHLLGSKEELGITCALIPTSLKGITIGRRHFPLNTSFMNGPTQGKDVFIPLEYIIGGTTQIGQGWRMLMECLSVGRAISLPSSAVGGAKAMTFACGAYARIREQFNVPLASFEGIIEPLARIAGYTYLAESLLRFTVAAIDEGAEPPLASAITKYHTTELSRKIVCDAMDIHGGKGICLGPNNYLGRGYQGTPISITVEGANILTRCLIIFGQGALRCHPFIQDELEAIAANDLVRFDRAFFSHLGYILSNQWRTFLLALTGARWTYVPPVSNKRYFQLLNRYCAAFAFVAESSMIALGGNLKRKEAISARLADMLSMLYITSAVLKRFEDDLCPKEDQPLVDWVCQTLFFDAQQALAGIINNFPNRLFKFVMKCIVFPKGKTLYQPTDELGKRVAALITDLTSTRSRLCDGIHQTDSPNNPMGHLQTALALVIEAEPIEKKLRHLMKKNHGDHFDKSLEEAVTKNIITPQEAEIAKKSDRARKNVIAVDDFDDKELRRVDDEVDKKIDKFVKEPTLKILPCSRHKPF